MKPEHKRSALNRLKTVRGHLEGILEMVEQERYCPQIMKQVSAVQGALERLNRVLLQNHLETCVPHAIAAGRAEPVIAELMETLRYTGALTGPGPETAAEESSDMSSKTSSTSLSVPDISCGHCKASIEGAVSKLPGVVAVEVNVATKRVRVELAEATEAEVVAAIEAQGYEVES